MWNEDQLNEVLSHPSEVVIEELHKLDGDIMILGAGGKIGPTLSVMASRASGRSGVRRRVYAVSRFSDPYVTALLDREKVQCIPADLTDDEALSALPRVPNIVFMAGRKFGTCQNAGGTWLMNVAVPDRVVRHFGAARYVVFSTGNIYPHVNVRDGGCDEQTPPDPVGEYAMTCLGRERIFEYAARRYGASVLMYRLNYAVDFRYGVLFDLAQKVLAGEPIPLGMEAFNCVWQHYASEVALRSLLLATPQVEYLNVTGPETVCVREAAEKLAAALGRKVRFTGEESGRALLSDASKCMRLFGRPSLGVDELIDLQAQWLLSGGRGLGKPTHFEEVRGKY